MPVPYKVVECSNPNGAEGVSYATNRRTKSGNYDFDDLAADISNAMSVTQSDVKGILAAYFYEIQRHIGDGNKVMLDGLGTFQAAVSSHCFLRSLVGSKDFRPLSYVTQARVRFTPDASLKKFIRQRVSLRRVGSSLMA